MGSGLLLLREPLCQVWWYIPITPVLWRQRLLDFYELKSSLVYTVSSTSAKIIQRGLVSKGGRGRQVGNGHPCAALKQVSYAHHLLTKAETS